jgi:hypothetical protein
LKSPPTNIGNDSDSQVLTNLDKKSAL